MCLEPRARLFEREPGPLGWEEADRLRRDKAELEAKLAETRRKLLLRIEQHIETKRELKVRSAELERAQVELEHWAAFSRSRSYRLTQVYMRVSHTSAGWTMRRAVGRLLRRLRVLG